MQSDLDWMHFGWNKFQSSLITSALWFCSANRDNEMWARPWLYLTWLSYDDRSIWNAGVLVVAVMLAIKPSSPRYRQQYRYQPLSPQYWQQSLCLLGIPTTSHASTLRKFTLWNTWQRPRPTTFHHNPLPIHLQTWIGSMRIRSGLVFLICSADTINMYWMWIRCTFNAQCRQALTEGIFCSRLIEGCLYFCICTSVLHIDRSCAFDSL